jgi:fumarylpyruvate hydrolase
MKGAVAMFVFNPRITSLPVVGSEDRFPVRRVYCVGRNYTAHVREMMEADERDPPFFFQKPTDAIVPDGGIVAYPPQTNDLQYEAELVVAVGASASAIPVDLALDIVFGYGVGVDLTRRDRQHESFKGGLPWEVGKAFDQSAPCGAIHPVGLVGHRMSGTISLSVNGQERQRDDLTQMIWNVPEIIAKLSQSYRLEPGDLIMTGTPAGVGTIVPGDTLIVSVEGLAPLTFSIVAGSA